MPCVLVMMKVPLVTVMELIPFKSPLAHVTSDDDEASSDTTQDMYATMLPPSDVSSATKNSTVMVGTSVTTERCDSRTSLNSTVNDVCRICHCESELGAPLISPCICSGSLKYVHQACLQQWIKSADTKSCELCKFNFQMTTKIKPFRKWQSLEMTTVERRKIMCSVTFHIIAITCVIWSLYVLIDRTTQEIKAGILEWPFWTKLIVVAIGFTGGLVFMYVQCKMYVQLCKRWRAYNRVIHIQNCPEKTGMKTPMQPQGNAKTGDPNLHTHTSVIHETELL